MTFPCQLPIDANGSHGCALFCCTNADCAAGPTGTAHCDLTLLADTHGVGICTNAADASLPNPSCGQQ